MTRSTEDRLAAALEARAQLVTPEALGPLEVPAPTRFRPTTGTVLMAVAASVAVAAAVSLPFVLDGGEPTRDPGPLTPTITSSSTPGPTVTGAPEPTGTDRPDPTGAPDSTGAPDPTGSADPTGSSAASEETVVADLDGDGVIEEVRVFITGNTDPYPVGGHLEVDLSGGGQAYQGFPGGYIDVVGAFSLNGDGRDQVLLQITGGGDGATLLVYSWDGDNLVRGQVDGDAPLGLELDGQGRVADYYVGDDTGLVSWLRVGDSVDGVAQVDTWTWRVEAPGNRLVPTPAGRACVDVTSQDDPSPC